MCDSVSTKLSGSSKSDCEIGVKENGYGTFDKNKECVEVVFADS